MSDTIDTVCPNQISFEQNPSYTDGIQVEEIIFKTNRIIDIIYGLISEQIKVQTNNGVTTISIVYDYTL